MKKKVSIPIFVLSLIVLLVFIFLFVGSTKEQKNINWGVNFSQLQAESLELNWRETYLAILDDLKIKNIKLITNWDWVEGEKDNFYFDDIDWQVKQSEDRAVKMIYVVGLKTGRWPECHPPAWLSSLSEDQQKQELLDYVKQAVLRYKDNDAIVAWQVENEPLFKFGECPEWYYKNDELLKEEVDLVKSLDPTRPVIISDSGNLSFWLGAAKVGDVVGITIYKKYWVPLGQNHGFYLNYFLPPISWQRRIKMINKFFHKKVINIELQAEPWTPGPYYDARLSEQQKTMNVDQFKENIKYAQQTGLDEFYLWGAEWWYWMKTKQHQPELWDMAKELF